MTSPHPALAHCWHQPTAADTPRGNRGRAARQPCAALPVLPLALTASPGAPRPGNPRSARAPPPAAARPNRAPGAGPGCARPPAPLQRHPPTARTAPGWGRAWALPQLSPRAAGCRCARAARRPCPRRRLRRAWPPLPAGRCFWESLRVDGAVWRSKILSCGLGCDFFPEWGRASIKCQQLRAPRVRRSQALTTNLGCLPARLGARKVIRAMQTSRPRAGTANQSTIARVVERLTSGSGCPH